MPFQWTDTFSVNIKEMDEQHKKWIDCYNALSDAMRERKEQAVLGNILDELARYTAYHFEAEERLFRKYEYPESREHTEEHDRMRKQVAEMHNNFNTGKLVLNAEVLNLLRTWLSRHILCIDKKYSDFLNNKGVF
jgi:hemerythrin